MPSGKQIQTRDNAVRSNPANEGVAEAVNFWSSSILSVSVSPVRPRHFLDSGRNSDLLAAPASPTGEGRLSKFATITVELS